MEINQFLTQLGWPEDHLAEAGSAKWSGSGSADLSTINATIDRQPSQVSVSVHVSSMEGIESLLSLSATIMAGQARIQSSQAGEPPEPIPAEDAIALFTHMSSGLPKFKFQSAGPLELPKTKMGA